MIGTLIALFAISAEVTDVTTSLVTSPRVRSNHRWSDDQLKSRIRPEVNFVSCFGFPPREVVPKCWSRHFGDEVLQRRARGRPTYSIGSSGHVEYLYRGTTARWNHGYFPGHRTILVEGIGEHFPVGGDVQPIRSRLLPSRCRFRGANHRRSKPSRVFVDDGG